MPRDLMLRCLHLQDANVRHASSGPPTKLQRAYTPPLSAGWAASPTRRRVSSTNDNSYGPLGQEGLAAKDPDLAQASRHAHPSMAARPEIHAEDARAARSGTMQHLGKLSAAYDL